MTSVWCYSERGLMPEELSPYSSLNLPPTPRQTRRIALLAQQLGYHEPVENAPKTRLEARNMIVGFKEELRKRRLE